MVSRGHGEHASHVVLLCGCRQYSRAAVFSSPCPFGGGSPCPLGALSDNTTEGRSSSPISRGDGSMSLRNLSPTVGTALAALLLTTLALAVLAPASANAEEACPNAALRFGSSANLPDCRAYEVVTPGVKEDNSFIFGAYGFGDGEHVFFASILPLPGAKNGSEQRALSSRTPAGWITTPLTVAAGQGVFQGPNETGSVSFTSDFSAGFIATTYAADPRDQNIRSDVYRVDIPSGSASIESLPDTGPMTEELYAPPPGVTYNEEETPQGSFVEGNSADGSHVFFETLSRLPTAPGTPADTH